MEYVGRVSGNRVEDNVELLVDLLIGVKAGLVQLAFTPDGGLTFRREDGQQCRESPYGGNSPRW